MIKPERMSLDKSDDGKKSKRTKRQKARKGQKKNKQRTTRRMRNSKKEGPVSDSCRLDRLDETECKPPGQKCKGDKDGTKEGMTGT